MPFLGELLAIGAAIFWAIGVIFFKKSGETMSPLALNFFKTTFGAVLLTPTVLLAGETLVPAGQPRDAWILIIASGVLGLTLADTLFFVSLEKLGASLVAVVDTSYTPLVFGVSYLLLDEQVGFWVYVGGGLIMSALIIGSAARPDKSKTHRDIVEGTLIGLAGIAMMALGIVIIKEVLNNAPLLWATWLRLFAGALSLGLMVIVSPRRAQMLASLKPGSKWKYALPAAFFGTYLSMITWIGGMKYTQVSRAAVLNQLSTIFIFILAAMYLKEPVTWRRALAIVLACAGAVIIVIKP